MAWVGAASLQVRHLLPRVQHEVGGSVCLATLRRVLRRAGYSWKRLRRRRKPPRDARAFAACQGQLAPLRAAEARGQLAL